MLVLQQLVELGNGDLGWVIWRNRRHGSAGLEGGSAADPASVPQEPSLRAVNSWTLPA